MARGSAEVPLKMYSVPVLGFGRETRLRWFVVFEGYVLLVCGLAVFFFVLRGAVGSRDGHGFGGGGEEAGGFHGGPLFWLRWG